MNRVVENFLLYEISDDWTTIGEIDAVVRQLDRLMAVDYSRERVLSLVRELLESEYIEAGCGGGAYWEPWGVSIDEAIRRIAYGFGGVPGYLEVSDDEIVFNEVFRANLTERGESRLEKLGDPYEDYGDPWYDDPFANVRELGYGPFHAG